LPAHSIKDEMRLPQSPQTSLELLTKAYLQARAYVKGLDSKLVFPSKRDLAALELFDEPMPVGGHKDTATLALLDRVGGPASVASTGGRYFGFVTGGVLPVAMAANWMAGYWDQNAAMDVMSPVAAKLEKVSGGWLKSMLELPSESEVSFVTGASMASFTAIAAARDELLARQGWDLQEKGLFGAPSIRVIVSAETHVTVLKSLALLGFGQEQLEVVPVDQQGRILIDAMPKLGPNCLVLCQAGNVNSGAFDDVASIMSRANQAWVHVDGAFGLWAQLVPELSHYLDGVEQADSWSVDGHKWLNVSYDCGIAIIRNGEALRNAFSAQAAYLRAGGVSQAKDGVPEFSRKARGIEVWAALRTLGRDGMADLVRRNCAQARAFAVGLQEIGYSVLNEVVLNQVVASIGDAVQMQQIQKLVEQDGMCWFGLTNWQGHDAFRISVSSWATTDQDVEKSLQSIRQSTEKVIKN